jgi:hypothetical protein
MLRTESSPADDPTVTVAGEQVSIPVEVRSAKMVGGIFTAPFTATRRLIEYSGLRPQKVAGTLALVIVSGVQYTDNDLGPYNEISLAIAVEPLDGAGSGPAALVTGNLTTFIHRLPVNQEFTCAAGRDIWGFPKWVADISFQERATATDVVMIDGGEFAMAMHVDRRFALPTPPSEQALSCYSFSNGVVRCTPWTMRLSGSRLRIGGASVEVGERNQLADDLRSLGFPKRALLGQAVAHLSCTFGRAEVVH